MKVLLLPIFAAIALIFLRDVNGQDCSVSRGTPNPREHIVSEGQGVEQEIVDARRATVGEVTSVEVMIRGNLGTNEFFRAEVTNDGSEVMLFPTEALQSRFMDDCTVEQCGYVPPVMEIYYTVRCSNGAVFPIETPMLIIRVEDENNNAHELETGPKVYRIETPIRGSPVNWNDPIKIYDEDVFFPNNYAVTSSNQSIIVVHSVKRIPDDVTQRLDHYELFLRLAENFNEAGQQTVTFTVRDDEYDSDYEATIDVEFNIDRVDLYIKTEGYNEAPLENIVREFEIAEIGGSTQVEIESKYKDRFGEPVVIDGKVRLSLNQPFTEKELNEENRAIRMTLRAIYDPADGNVPQTEASVAITLVYKILADITIEPFYQEQVTGEEDPDDVIIDFTGLEPDLQFTTEDPMPAYLTLGNDRIIRITDPEAANDPGVDVFTVVASRSDGAIAKTVIVIHRNPPPPPTSPPTTVTPVECTTVPQEYTECPTITPCDCATTEPVTECPTTVTVSECPTTEITTECPPCSTDTPQTCTTTETQTECPPCSSDTPQTCPTTETQTECPPCSTDTTIMSTDCPTTPPPPTDCPTTPSESECPVTCPETTTTEQCDCSTCPTDPPPECQNTSEPCECTGSSSIPPECPPTSPPPECTTPSEPCECTSPADPPITGSPPTPGDCPEVTCPSTECTTTPEQCDCSVTGAPSTDCPAVTCPSTECTTTPEQCDCSVTGTPSTDCPAVTCPSTECPTTPEQCDCSVTGAPSTDCPVVTCPSTECPTTPEPVTGGPPSTDCPVVTCPANPIPCECNTSPRPSDEDCSTGGLVAGIAVVTTLAVISTAAVGYLVYTYIYQAGRAFAPSGTEFATTKPSDPEMGVNNNNHSFSQKSLGGNGTQTSANFRNGDFGPNGNGSLSASSAPSFQQGNVPKSGFDSFGAIRSAEAVSPIAAGGILPATYPSSKNAASAPVEPEYSYAKSGSDIAPVSPKSPDTASVAESIYAQPSYEAKRKTSLAKKDLQDPKVPEVPVQEPKVDYNRVNFGSVEIIPEEIPEAEEPEDVDESAEGSSEGSADADEAAEGASETSADVNEEQETSREDDRL